MSIQNEKTQWQGIRSKELRLIQRNHTTVNLKTKSSAACCGVENLQQKQSQSEKSTQNAGKATSQFLVKKALLSDEKP